MTNYPCISESLEASGDHIDVLVNNAGYSIYGPVETLTEDEVRAQMDTLYFGPLRLIRAVVPHMRERKYGVIVNMSSGAGLEGRDSMGGYAGAKAALDGKYPEEAFHTSYTSVLITTVQGCPRSSPKKLRHSAYAP